MASFHLSAQVVKRSQGRSAVAMAAYRSGQSLADQRADKVQDFSRRRGIAHEEIMAPDVAPAWIRDRELLWNHVEAMENRRDAQLARELNVALPAELTHEQRLALVRQFVREEFVSRGMIADIALHDPVPAKGDDPRNFHAHIMLTMRKATANGLHSVKTREWNSDEMLKGWRSAWAKMQNDHLERAGHRDRVDHRTLQVQREEAQRAGDRRRAAQLDRTPEIHVGPKARAAARRGHTPQSKPREVGLRQQARREPLAPGFNVKGARAIFNQKPGRQIRVRQVDYPAIDKGNRLAFLGDILKANNEKVRLWERKLDRQAARLARKLDYWEKQVNCKRSFSPI